MQKITQTVRLKRLGIDTYKEAVIYLRCDSHICRAEGFATQARIRVTHANKMIIATLNTISTDLLAADQAGLSEYAWQLLDAKEGDEVFLAHPKPLYSLSYIRSKIYSNNLTAEAIKEIIADVLAGNLSDIHIAAFITACAGGRLNQDEITLLTKTMVEAGQRLQWPTQLVVDKHCIGGLPGNRTTLIVVPIVAAFGLTIPKTSSRAITSPAGTADTMEVLAPVNLDTVAMRKVVEQEGGCVIWGGAVSLSPADDALIRVERALNLDGEGQLVASVLSKKIAAGSTHIVIDIPIGPTVKVRSNETAVLLKKYLEATGRLLGVQTSVIFTDGTQPIGRGIGPVLEARDVLAVLQNQADAPQDLREKALLLAGAVLEFSPAVVPGTGKKIATDILNSGQAWKKFQAICAAQGGLRELPRATYTHVVTTKKSGKVLSIDNRLISQIAKLAGAPNAKAAGVELHASIGTIVSKGQPLFTIHAATRGELEYALTLVEEQNEAYRIFFDGQ